MLAGVDGRISSAARREYVPKYSTLIRANAKRDFGSAAITAVILSVVASWLKSGQSLGCFGLVGPRYYFHPIAVKIFWRSLACSIA